MLILTRRVNESILIGDDIEVKVTGMYGNQVRIAVQAPKHIPIHRNELRARMKLEEEK